MFANVGSRRPLKPRPEISQPRPQMPHKATHRPRPHADQGLTQTKARRRPRPDADQGHAPRFAQWAKLQTRKLLTEDAPADKGSAPDEMGRECVCLWNANRRIDEAKSWSISVCALESQREDRRHKTNLYLIDQSPPSPSLNQIGECNNRQYLYPYKLTKRP